MGCEGDQISATFLSSDTNNQGFRLRNDEGRGNPALLPMSAVRQLSSKRAETATGDSKVAQQSPRGVKCFLRRGSGGNAMPPAGVWGPEAPKAKMGDHPKFLGRPRLQQSLIGGELYWNFSHSLVLRSRSGQALSCAIKKAQNGPCSK